MKQTRENGQNPNYGPVLADLKTNDMKQLMFLVSIRYLLVTKTLSRSSDTTIQPSLDATNAQFPAP